jgi:preprotein translocase subunit SecA
VKKQVFEKAREAYDIRETAYPIMAAVYRYGGGARGMNDKEGLANWARERLQATFDPEQFRGLERKEVFQLLAPFSHKSQERAEEALAEVHRKLESLFGPEAKNTKDNRTAKEVQGGNGALTSVARWASETLGRNLDADAIGAMTRTELDKTLRGAVENRYRPEIRLMERQLLLQIVDELWKDHLLVMDRLRSAIGLVGYAQVDPKVEYKREGMRLFEQMWGVVGQRATELVFKIEHLSEDFVSSVWVETAATHAEAGSLVETATRTAEETSSSGGGDVEAKREPIRNRGQRVGRNDPCPCGSGKKFKTCCMRREVV